MLSALLSRTGGESPSSAVGAGALKKDHLPATNCQHVANSVLVWDLDGKLPQSAA